MVALGLFFAVYAQRYTFGTLSRMGPGYFPVALGAVLAILGVLVALPAWFRSGSLPSVNWKSFVIVTASVMLFAATLQTLGILFATAITVFLASLADNQITWRGRAILCVAIAVILYLVFIAGLSMVLPVWPWSD